MPGFGSSDEKWYHEIRLTIRDSEVLVEASPVFVKNRIKTASASDGGFWTYKGQVVHEKRKLFLKLPNPRCVFQDSQTPLADRIAPCRHAGANGIEVPF